VAGRGSHLAADNLALVLEDTGRTEEAARLRSQWPELAVPNRSDSGLLKHATA